MTTIAEKTATTGQLISDVASAALALAEWEDGDAYVTNDQATDNWYDNGRLLHHTPSGQYVLLFISDNSAQMSNNNTTNYKGIRIIASNDWDGVNHHPAGYTSVHTDDPFSNDVGNDARASFTHHEHTGDDNYNDAGQEGIWYFSHRNGTRSEQAADTVTYFASVGASWLNIGAWNNADGNNGRAGYYSFEYVDNKFWADGNDPFALCCQANTSGSDDFRISAYGYQYYDQNRGMDNNHPYNGSGTDRGKWGVVNPDSEDDTFFFQRPVLYLTNNQTVPVAYIEDAISNDTDEGGSHGDTITHGGATYRVFRQSGAGSGNVHSVGLRYE